MYKVSFQVSVTEAGQLIMVLNTADIARTVVGRATGTSQIVGFDFIEITSPSSILEIQNPAGSSTALTITPLAGGVRPVAATLLVERMGDLFIP